MIIDVHAHYMTDSCWGDEWVKNWQPRYGNKAWPQPSVEDFNISMRNIDVAIVFGMRATAVNVGTPNEILHNFLKKVEVKTIGFMALDPNDKDVLEQMREGVSFGFRGIKLYPTLAKFDPRETKFKFFFKAAQKNELVMLWHMGASPSARANLRLSDPLLLDEVAQLYPGTSHIIAHLGHPWQREAILVLRKNTKVFADISGIWARPSDGFQALVRAQEWNVTNKLLFGSDYPLWTPTEAIDGLRHIGALRAGSLPFVTKETIEGIIEQNSLDKLGLGF